VKQWLFSQKKSWEYFQAAASDFFRSLPRSDGTLLLYPNRFTSYRYRAPLHQEQSNRGVLLTNRLCLLFDRQLSDCLQWGCRGRDRTLAGSIDRTRRCFTVNRENIQLLGINVSYRQQQRWIINRQYWPQITSWSLRGVYSTRTALRTFTPRTDHELIPAGCKRP
jgi:hypothetical protein